MKCPKCGYNSFEIHDTCKKCANDLTSYKDIHGLKSIVLPQETRTLMAEKMLAEKVPDSVAGAVDAPTDMFSFDIPEDETATGAGSFRQDDPFNFADEPAAPPRGEDVFSFGKDEMSAQARAEEEAFANLLESTTQTDGAAFSAPQAAGTENQGGSGLNDFSWDDTPDAAPGATAKPAEDDFNNLFGDTDDTAKK